MEMNSQTVKHVCDSVQVSHGKAEVLCHNVYAVVLIALLMITPVDVYVHIYCYDVNL